MTEQMDQPRPGTANLEQGAHKECTGQRWAQTTSNGVRPNPWIGRPPTEAVQAHLWREDHFYPLEGGYQRPSLISLGNRPIRTIKGASLTPSHTHHSKRSLPHDNRNSISSDRVSPELVVLGFCGIPRPTGLTCMRRSCWSFAIRAF